jgi:ferredoxin
VSVCPTGIDIRNGTQMECVNCTACIDACDEVMDRIHHPRGLIRFASLDGIEKGERPRLTPRLAGYCAILLALAAGLAALLLTRSEVDITLLRAPGVLFSQAPDGKLSNLYLLKLTNKTRYDKPVELKLENVAGSLTVLGGQLNVPAEKQTEASVLVEIAPDNLASGNTPVVVGVYCAGKRIDRIKTVFIGPRKQPYPGGKSEIRRPKSEARREIRNPKAEIRRKSEIRNPKAEIAKFSGIGSALSTESTGDPVSRSDRTERGTGCGFRISDFGFPSDFGASDFGFPLPLRVLCG